MATSRSYEVTVKGNETYIIIQNIPLKIWLREPEKVIDVPKKYTWESRTMKLTGTLCLTYDRFGRSIEKEWHDAKSVKLEDKLAVIMAYFKLKADQEIRWEK